MIGFLCGELRERRAERLLVVTGGVGYLVHAPASTLTELPRPGSPESASVSLHVSTQVREDSITLYGFLSAAERRSFEMLLSVSGVGPRIGLAALSALGPAELARAIAEGDAARLATIPGVGRKTAERMVVDLRDRLARALGDELPAGAASPAPEGSDAVSALVNLGYAERPATKAVQAALEEAEEAPPFDELLRAALRRLSRA